MHKRIVNTKNDSVIGVRLKKYNIGRLNLTTSLCDRAWLEIYEEDEYDTTTTAEATTKGFRPMSKHYFTLFFSIK